MSMINEIEPRKDQSRLGSSYSDNLKLANTDEETLETDDTFQIGMIIEEIPIDFNFDGMESVTEKTMKRRIKEYILDIIKENPGIKTSEILEEVEYDEWEVLNILDELAEEGKVD